MRTKLIAALLAATATPAPQIKQPSAEVRSSPPGNVLLRFLQVIGGDGAGKRDYTRFLAPLRESGIATPEDLVPLEKNKYLLAFLDEVQDKADVSGSEGGRMTPLEKFTFAARVKEFGEGKLAV